MVRVSHDLSKKIARALLNGLEIEKVGIRVALPLDKEFSRALDADLEASGLRKISAQSLARAVKDGRFTLVGDVGLMIIPTNDATYVILSIPSRAVREFLDRLAFIPLQGATHARNPLSSWLCPDTNERTDLVVLELPNSYLENEDRVRRIVSSIINAWREIWERYGARIDSFVIMLAGRWYNDKELSTMADVNELFYNKFLDPVIVRFGNDARLSLRVASQLAEKLRERGIDAHATSNAIVVKFGNVAFKVPLHVALSLSDSKVRVYHPTLHPPLELGWVVLPHLDATLISVDENVDLDNVADRLASALKKLGNYVAQHRNVPILTVGRAPMELLFELSEEPERLGSLKEVVIEPRSSKEAGATHHAMREASHYDISRKRVVIRGDRERLLHVIVHELTHALSYGFDKRLPREFFEKHPDLFNEAKQVLIEIGYYYLDPHHITDPEEVFAEIVEVLALYPRWLEKHHPKLYRELQRFLKERAPRFLETLRKYSFSDPEKLMMVLEKLKRSRSPLAKDIPYDILRILLKPTSRLTQHEKELLIRYAVSVLGADRFMRDVVREAKRKARYVYTWIMNPSKTDIPGVDTPASKPIVRKLREKERIALSR